MKEAMQETMEAHTHLTGENVMLEAKHISLCQQFADITKTYENLVAIMQENNLWV